MEFMRKRREKRYELAQMAVDQNEGREGQNERDIGFVLGETITVSSGRRNTGPWNRIQGVRRGSGLPVLRSGGLAWAALLGVQ